MTLATILGVILSGLLVGALARLAVPGPDPMPLWKTILFGVAGSFLGGGIGYGLGGNVGALVGAVIAATVLILLYRRFVQKRPITGPGARLPPG
ncbi:MAG: GlsB/YeaQ/YmgE family stress response membrane protein [Gaiellaceae bacterium]